MFQETDVRRGPSGWTLKAGSFIGSSRANPLSRIGAISDSLLLEDGKLSGFPVRAEATAANEILLRFGALRPVPAAALATSLRASALERVRQLARLARLAGADALPLVDGVVPLWCVYFTERGVLVLSKELCEVVGATLGDEEAFGQSFALSWPPFPDKLAAEWVQLLYYAAAGFLPFADERVRGAGAARFLRLGEMFKGGGSLCQTLDRALLSRERFDAEALLGSLDWNLDFEAALDEEGLEKARSRLERKAASSRFWRRRGPALAAAAVVLAAVAWFLGGFVSKQFGPPPSAGLGPEALVARYYDAQSRLDMETLTDTLAFGVRSPAATEVAALHVARATRIGYENFDCLLSPDDWEASGRGPLEEGKLVYGVRGLEMEALDADTIRATSLVYKTENPEEGEGFATIMIFRQVEDFSFERKGGWLRMDGIGEVESALVESVDVSTYPGRRPQLP